MKATAPPESRPSWPRIRRQVARFLGAARASEQQLFDGLMVVAERHEREYEIRQGTTTLAAWSRDDLDSLATLEARYGTTPSDAPDRLRSVLFDGSPAGAPGALQDLQDLTLLAEQAAMAWLILFQGAKELHDEVMLRVATRARDHVKRQLAWLRTQIEHDAPEPLAVVMDEPVRGPVPRRQGR